MNKNIIALFAVAAIFILGGFAYMTMNNDDSDETSQNSDAGSSMQNTPASQNESAQSKDIVELAVGTDSLSTLVSAVQAADLVETLQSSGPFTVFAPTNDAFAALPDGTLDTLLMAENKEQLASILTYHVVSGRTMSSDLANGQQIKTLAGGMLTVEIMNDVVYIVDAKGTKAQVSAADIEASNGVVHVINSVLLPQ